MSKEEQGFGDAGRWRGSDGETRGRPREKQCLPSIKYKLILGVHAIRIPSVQIWIPRNSAVAFGSWPIPQDFLE